MLIRVRWKFSLDVSVSLSMSYIDSKALVCIHLLFWNFLKVFFITAGLIAFNFISSYISVLTCFRCNNEDLALFMLRAGKLLNV